MKRKHAQRKRKAGKPSFCSGVSTQSESRKATEHLESGERIVEMVARRHDTPAARLFTQVDLHTESNFFSGFSGDLSDGGLFVATYAPLSLGQPVEVELSLPGGKFYSATGRVAWLRRPAHDSFELAPGAGIVFEELGADARKAAESFMLRREPTFVDAN